VVVVVRDVLLALVMALMALVVVLVIRLCFHLMKDDVKIQITAGALCILLGSQHLKIT
jgi:hypothetical protein